jgi:ribosomal protein L28
MIIEDKRYIIKHLVEEGNIVSVSDGNTEREVEVVNMIAGRFLLRENGEFVRVVKTIQQVFMFFGLN